MCEWPTVRKHVSKITHAFQGNTTSFLTKHIMYTNTWQIGFWSSCTAIGWQNDVLNTMYWGALRFQGVLKWVWRPNITQPWLYSQPMSGVAQLWCAGFCFKHLTVLVHSMKSLDFDCSCLSTIFVSMHRLPPGCFGPLNRCEGGFIFAISGGLVALQGCV